MRQILRLNLTTGTVRREPLAREMALLGGRGLLDAILTAEVDPAGHPLGPGNKLILAPGLFAGTSLPTSSRLSVGGKSPLTGGIKEANVGGNAGQVLARMGLAALVAEGQAGEGTCRVLFVGPQGTELEDRPELKMKGNYETAAALRQRYGEEAVVVSIGPCGEMGMAAASVAVTDLEGRPCRHAGRGGLGAVMGSRGLKAVVLDPAGLKMIKGERPEEFARAAKAYSQQVAQGARNPFWRDYGTPGIIDAASGRGSLPTRYFREGSYDKRAGINGQRFKELIDERGGQTGQPCMSGCLVRCSNVFNDAEGEYLTSGLEYETICLLGSNLDIDDLDTVARLDFLCDDYGLDTIETGAALGALSQTELFSLGDGPGAIELVHQIGRGTVLGRVLGQGAAVVGRVFGLTRVAAVKGQSIPAHAPRALKGLGVTYATSPQGADHTAGFVIEEPLSNQGQSERSRKAQLNSILADTLGICQFAEVDRTDLDLFAGLMGPLLGLEVTPEEVKVLAREALLRERDFNLAAGLGPAFDRLPEFMAVEPLPPHEEVFDVSREDLARVFGELDRPEWGR